MDPRTAAVTLLQRGRADPLWFIRTVLGERLWTMQEAIARAVFTHRRVAVKACHASGKTRVAADIALAFFYLFPGCKILTTAPTWVGVEKLLWAEIGRGFAHLPRGMGGELTRTQLR